MEIPQKAISVIQPWAWLIVAGHKDIENRYLNTNFRGPVAIHASRKVDVAAQIDVDHGIHPVTAKSLTFKAPGHYAKGGIIGVADIVDCVTGSRSDWFEGPYGFVLANARMVDFIPCRGNLGFFDWRQFVYSDARPMAQRELL